MRAAEWVSAFVGSAICLAGAMITAERQIEPFEIYRSPLESLWPMPGLSLIDWALLGVVGLVSVALGTNHRAWMWSKVTWAVCGALIVLMIVGMFSIGPIVMWATLCFGLAAALAWARQKPYVAADSLAFALGAFGNLMMLLAFILIARV